MILSSPFTIFQDFSLAGFSKILKNLETFSICRDLFPSRFPRSQHFPMKSSQEDICSKRRSWRRSREQRMDQSPAPNMCYLDSPSFIAIFWLAGQNFCFCWWNWVEWEEMDGCWDGHVMSWEAEMRSGVYSYRTRRRFWIFWNLRQDLQWRLSICEVESIIESSLVYVKEVCRKFLTFKWPCWDFILTYLVWQALHFQRFFKDDAWSSEGKHGNHCSTKA